MTLVPEFLGHGTFWLLVVVSFFTSLLTAAVGLGGGSILLAVMAQVVPVKAIIPLHGIVQLGSNFGRALILLPTVNKELLAWFAGGSLLGALLGGQLVITLPVDVLRVVLGVFLLYVAWGPQLRGLIATKGALAAGGILSTFLTMFVGATGPFVLAMLRPFSLAPVSQVSSLAACLVVQHSLKLLVFGLLGFAYAPYVPLIVLMVASGFAGTLLGRRILLAFDPRLFTRLLNVVLTLLALRLVLLGLQPLLFSG